MKYWIATLAGLFILLLYLSHGVKAHNVTRKIIVPERTDKLRNLLGYDLLLKQRFVQAYLRGYDMEDSIYYDSVNLQRNIIDEMGRLTYLRYPVKDGTIDRLQRVLQSMVTSYQHLMLSYKQDNMHGEQLSLATLYQLCLEYEELLKILTNNKSTFKGDIYFTLLAGYANAYRKDDHKQELYFLQRLEYANMKIADEFK